MVSRIPPASPGRDHVGEEVVEDLGVLAHGVGEAGAALDVHPGLLQDLREGLVLLLAAQDLEALHERQAGVDHDRELAGEDREVLGGHAAAELGQGDLACPSPSPTRRGSGRAAGAP